MELRNRLIGPSATRQFRGADEPILDVDLGALLRRLILFDTYILESYRFREILKVVEVAGVEGAIHLLESGALKLFCDLVAFAERTSPKPAPSEYAFATMVLPDRASFVERCFFQLGEFSNIPSAEMIRLRSAIMGALVDPFPQAAWAEAIDQSITDFTTESVLSAAVAESFKRILGRPVERTELKLLTQKTGNMSVVVRSNLRDRFLLSEEDERRIIGSALRALSGLAFRLQHMKTYSAISGLRDQEITLLDNKVSFLIRELDPKLQDEQFRRVIAIGGLPDFDSAIKVDMEKLLDIRRSRECIEFRQWLRTIQAESDTQIRDRITSIRERLGTMVHGKTGRVARFLVTSGIGLIPVVGNIAGPVFSGLDTFVVDELLTSSGPISFISKSYPSLF